MKKQKNANTSFTRKLLQDVWCSYWRDGVANRLQLSRVSLEVLHSSHFSLSLARAREVRGCDLPNFPGRSRIYQISTPTSFLHLKSKFLNQSSSSLFLQFFSISTLLSLLLSVFFRVFRSLKLRTPPTLNQGVEYRYFFHLFELWSSLKQRSADSFPLEFHSILYCPHH